MNFDAFCGRQRKTRATAKSRAIQQQQNKDKGQQQAPGQPEKQGGEVKSPFLRSLICFNKGEIAIRVIYVIGKQRTGKTTMVNAMVKDLQDGLGDQVDYRITNDIKDLLSREWMSIKKPYLIRFVDDAGRMQFSRDGMDRAQKSKIIDMKEIAHIAEESGFKEGCITIFYGAQNETLVDYQLRSEAEVIMIKWLNLSIKEHRELIQGLKNFDDADREKVENWIEGIRLREIWALSLALVILPTRKWGWYRFEKKECKIDQQLKHYKDEKGEGETVVSVTRKDGPAIPVKALGVDGSADLKEAIKQLMETMKKEDQWSKKILCYESVKNGATENDTAIKIFGDISKQQTVSLWKRQAQGELKRRLGAIYENAVTIRLANEGYAVQHLGGAGEPDIIAIKDGKAQAVSCKIYEDPRKVVSIEPGQFRPEINFTVKNNSEKFILFFYNLVWEKEVIRYVDKDTDTVTLRLSECT